MPPLIELRDVVVRRGGRETLRAGRLSLAPGEVLAVIGPNGAGKSTLLQVAALLLSPSEGMVCWNGVPVAGNTLPYRRRIAVTLQEALLLDASVLENAALGLKLRGVRRREREMRARSWLQRFGVAHLAERNALRLSGGEAQRVSLARAFALDPAALFLDEPFAGLDQPTRAELLRDLAGALAGSGVATLFVTHDRDEAMRLADNVAVVLGCRLRQLGGVSEVFGAPADEEVAAFVGVENITPGRIVEWRDGLATVALGGRRLQALARERLPEQVRVCVRPEDIVVQPASEDVSPGSARNLLVGRITEVHLAGPEARLVIDCGFPLVAAVTRLSVEDLGLVTGARVAALFKATAVHLLPGSGP